MNIATIISDINQYVNESSDTDFLFKDNGTVHTGLQRLPISDHETSFKWTQPGNVGNTGGQSTKPHGSFSWLNDNVAVANCKGIANQEDNFYFYMSLPIPSKLPTRVVDYRTHTIDNTTNWQGLEWQQQLSLGGKTWNCGAWQFSFTSGIRIWNHQDKKWNPAPSNIPFPNFTKTVTTRCEYALTPDTMTHVSITINDAVYVVGISQPAVVSTSPDKFTIAEQIDPKKGLACNLIVSDIELRYI